MFLRIILHTGQHLQFEALFLNRASTLEANTLVMKPVSKPHTSPIARNLILVLAASMVAAVTIVCAVVLIFG